MKQQSIVVIGAGFGGLSAAALLAEDGHNVTVLEKHTSVGGRARVWKEAGFVFDMGPSWYMMPDVFERFFAQFGKKPSDYYQLTRLDPSYRIYFDADDTVDVSANLEANIALFESIETGAGNKLREYLAQAAYQYNVSIDQFLYKDFRSIFDLFNKRILAEGRKLHVFENLDAFTKRYFKSDKLRKILEYSMVFFRGAPKNTPALYSVMTHADMQLGIWYPQGGFGSVVQSMQRLAEEKGVRFLVNHEVTKINVSNNQVHSVVTSQGEISADIVLANADYHYVETELLPKNAQSYSDRYWEHRTMAPSAFIMYLGLNKKLSNVQHHMLMLEHDWMNHFDAIFDKPAWPDRPSYYVCCPSQTDATVAPEGCENIFILVPVASGLLDTPEQREQYGVKIVTHFEQTIGQSIQENIVVKRTFSLNDFAEDYHAYKGTALGFAHTLFQTSYFRPRTQSKKLSNLYYVGQGTQPGVGVPMTIISGQLARDNIRNQYAND